MRLALTSELNERVSHSGVIQEGKFIAAGYLAPVDAGMVVQIVISAQPRLVKQLVNGLASMATKILFVEIQIIVGAVFTAVVTFIYRVNLFVHRKPGRVDVCIFQRSNSYLK